MKREIKFRAICQADEIERMVYFEAQEFDNGIQAWPTPNNINRIDEYLSPLMQYTGLKDKNGKEIYEGDICKYELKDDEDKILDDGVGEITYDDWAFWCGNYPAIQATEVVGNIFENPELTKKQLSIPLINKK